MARWTKLCLEYTLSGMVSLVLSMFLIALRRHALVEEGAQRACAERVVEKASKQKPRGDVTAPTPRARGLKRAHCHELRSVTSPFFSLFGRGGKLQRDL